MWYLNGKPNEIFVSTSDAFSIHEIDTINQIFDTTSLDEGVAVNSSTGLRKSKIGWIDHSNPDLEWVYRKLTDLTINVNTNFFNYDLVSLESLQLSEYDEFYEGKYGKHVDYGFDSLINRKLSFSLQLSDPQEYEGGDLILHHSSNPATMSKEKGTLVFFPSFLLHEVTEITKGKRRSLVGWVNGPQFR